MLHSITVNKSFIWGMILLVLLMTSTMSSIECKALIKSTSLQTENFHLQNVDSNSKQMLFIKGIGGETSTPDFIRLVVMRFIYGLASNMGVEERLDGLFNGAFVPPNADGDLFGLGSFGDDIGDVGDAGDFDEAALGGLFGDDAF